MKTNKARRSVAITSIAAVGILGLSACSSSSSQSAPTAASTSVTTAPAVSVTTDAAFAQSMIPHHQQAVEMADLALAPNSGASPEVQALATQIKNAQGPEIDQMNQWLQAWRVGSGNASHDMGGMDHDMGGITMTGMMSGKQMDRLMKASGTNFDTLWLTMMIEHHEGAIQMAEQVAASSSNPEVTALAEQIIIAQQDEINQMRQMLDEGQ